jgi:subtilisin
VSRPAWSLPAEASASIGLQVAWPERPTREWAFGGSTGEGVRVCVLDSGVDRGHPLVQPIASAVAVEPTEGEAARIVEDEVGDVCGHGTACAGVVRSLAPGCEIHSVRVLGAGATGSGDLILAGLEHAIEQGFDVINMSLSTTKKRFAERLHELADGAYFRRAVLVAAAHNMPVESFPWRFSSVISVGSHEEGDSWAWYANPSPPVEFLAPSADPAAAQEPALHDRLEHGRSVMDESVLRAAVAAGTLGSEEQHRALLQSVVDVARAIFRAKASSIFLLDEDTEELVFEAVSGEGEGELVGMRLPASEGIAGWVLVTRQPLAIDDLTNDPRFARGSAERTGYVPKAIMSVPLLHDESALGVLSVLDPPAGTRFGIAEMDLLGLFAAQAAIGLDLLQRARRAHRVLEDDASTAASVARLAAILDARDDDAGRRLLAALEDVLDQD